MVDIAIFGSHSGHNKGDVAILNSMVERFRQESKINKITIPSKDLSYLRTLLSADKYCLTSSRTNYLDRRLVQDLRDTDSIIIGGGGLIFDRKLLSLGYNHLTNIFLLTKLCKLFSVDYYLFSIGVDELANNIARQMFRSVVQQAAGVSVRDQYSLRETQQYTNSEVTLCPDPALRLTPIRSDHVSEVEDRFEASDRPLLAFFVKDTARNRKKELVDIISSLSDTYTVYIGQTRTDQSFAHQLSESLGKKCTPMFDENHLNGKEHIELTKRFDRAVCMPMHSSIFAYLAKTPYLSIAYQPKVRGFNELVENDYVVSLTNLAEIPQYVAKLNKQDLVSTDVISEQVESGFASLINKL
jgi:polysaccharide pyruvyl transferase WcaK-like protein